MNLKLEGQADVSNEASLQHDSSWWMDVFTPGRLAVLIGLLLFALYPGVILGTQSFFYHDFGAFTYPVAYFTHESFWHGQVPLWNPLNNCGIPFLAQWNTSVCYPLSLIFMLFPLPQSLNYFCLIHLVLAGLGMYRLAYRWTQNRLAASIASLVFALSGVMLSILIWTSNLAALSWQPWVIFWGERAWRTGGRWLAVAALAGATQMLAGAPEIIVFTWTMLSLLWLGQVWRKQVPFWPTLCRLVVVVAAIAGLAAIQLLPFLDLLKHSERNAAYSANIADAYAMPLWGWANFLVPVFHTLPTFFGTRYQPNQSWISSYYPGIGTIALALVAVCRRRQAGIYALAGLTLAGLALSLGNAGYVYTALKHILPWIGFARYPIKFISIPAFTIPLLAACGFDTLYHATSQSVKRNKRALILIVAFLVLTIIVILAMARWELAAKYDWPMTWRDGALRALLLAALAGMIITLFRIPSARLHTMVGLAILVLMGFDLVTAGMRENPVVVTKAFGPLDLNLTTRPKANGSRVMVSRQVLSYLDLHSAGTKNPLYYYVGLRDALIENCNIPENISKVSGFWSLHLKNEWDINEIFYGVYRNAHGSYQFGTNALPTPLLNFLGVSEISASNTIFTWRPRQAYMPLATAGQQPVFAGDAETVEKLQSADFNPRQTVYLPLSERGKVVVSHTSDAKVISQQFGAQSVHLLVEASASALVVIAQSFYHNWHAYVDGKPVPIWRANHAFQAVAVPAGRHQIILRYEDRRFRLGALVSALTLLGCLAGLFVTPKAEP